MYFDFAKYILHDCYFGSLKDFTKTFTSLKNHDAIECAPDWLLTLLHG